MTVPVTIHKAKTYFSRLIRAVLAGEEIAIAHGKQPLEKMVVLPRMRPRRRIGGGKGVIEYISDDFDAPLKEFHDYM